MPVRRINNPSRTTAVVHPGVPVTAKVTGICVWVGIWIVLLDHFPFELLQHVDRHVQRFGVVRGQVLILARVSLNVKQTVAVKTLVRPLVGTRVIDALIALDNGLRSNAVKQMGRNSRVHAVGF